MSTGTPNTLDGALERIADLEGELARVSGQQETQGQPLTEVRASRAMWPTSSGAGDKPPGLSVGFRAGPRTTQPSVPGLLSRAPKPADGACSDDTSPQLRNPCATGGPL